MPAHESSYLERRRRSVRLQGYDYTQVGAYFVTICTQDRSSLFGDIKDREMRLNEAALVVQETWNVLPAHDAGVETDAFVVVSRQRQTEASKT